MAKLISKTYGEALYEIAMENGKADAFLEEIGKLESILAENPDFSRLMNHPKIPKQEKIDVIEQVFRGKIHDELTGLLVLVLQKERYGELNNILQYFVDKVKEEKGVGSAYVTTAVALSDTQKAQVKTRLLETTQYKEMEMQYAIDEKLIGGMIVRIGHRVVDSSIKTKLEELAKQLYKLQLQ